MNIIYRTILNSKLTKKVVKAFLNYSLKNGTIAYFLAPYFTKEGSTELINKSNEILLKESKENEKYYKILIDFYKDAFNYITDEETQTLIINRCNELLLVESIKNANYYRILSAFYKDAFNCITDEETQTLIINRCNELLLIESNKNGNYYNILKELCVKAVETINDEETQLYLVEKYRDILLDNSSVNSEYYDVLRSVLYNAYEYITDDTTRRYLIKKGIEILKAESQYDRNYYQINSDYYQDIFNNIKDDKTIISVLAEGAELINEKAPGNNQYRNIQEKIVRDTILTGISECAYDKLKKIILIRGWLLPSANYDLVEVIHKNKKIGEAILHQKREDIYQNYKVYNEHFAGWIFQVETIIDDFEEPVCLAVYKDGKRVITLEHSIEQKDIQVLLDIQPINENVEYVRHLFSKNELEKSINIFLESVSNKHKRECCLSDYLISENDIYYTNENVERIAIWNNICKSLKNWLPWQNIKFYERWERKKYEIIVNSWPIEEELINLFSDLNVIHFVDADIQYQDSSRLWIIIDEILINEEYYFDSNTNEPFILDCGANIGLASYYFIHMYPNAKIMAFEPEEEAFSILNTNISNNGWEQRITAYQVALDEKDMVAEFIIPDNDCLGASLTKRPIESSNTTLYHKQKVVVRRLDNYISDDTVVDYLKMDIEGVEVRVLRSIRFLLSNIKNIFCEYHFGETVEDNSYTELLQILEASGFSYQESKSPSYYRSTQKKTWNHVGKKVSLNIWAKRCEMVDAKENKGGLIDVQCTYYSALSFLRINANVSDKDNTHIDVLMDSKKIGNMLVGIYVNDEKSEWGSSIWNSCYTQRIDNLSRRFIELCIRNQMNGQTQNVVAPISYVDSIPNCFQSSIGTKNTLTINDNREESYIKQFRSRGYNAKLTKLCIETSALCNLRCKYCVVGQDYNSIDRGIISEDVLNECIRIINLHPSIEIVQLNALGEPLTLESFSQVCQRVYQDTHVRHIYFFTNGMLMNKKIVDALIKLPLRFSIYVSIDGSNEQEYEKKREGGRFKTIEQNLYYLLKMTQKKSNWKIKINNLVLVNGAEATSIPSFILDKFGMIGIDSHRPFYFPGLSDEFLNDNGMKKVVHQEKKLCKRCFYESTIRFNGDIIRCHWDSKCDEVMGNVLEDSFDEIWNGKKYKKMRRLMEQNETFEHLPESCQKCHAMNNGVIVSD